MDCPTGKACGSQGGLLQGVWHRHLLCMARPVPAERSSCPHLDLEPLPC